METIKRGSKGTDTKIAQALLRSTGFTGADGNLLAIDGDAGDNTIFAINVFQSLMRKYGVECGTAGKNDGEFGKACWEVFSL